MGIATTDFPGALDSKDSLVWAANNASTTLATTINSTDTSIVLTSGAAFPSSGIVLIDSELIAYSSKATDTLTVQASPTGRGYESTTAAGHTAGAVVRLVISAASHNVQSDAIIATQTKIGTGASTPAANVVLTGTGTGTSAWATISNAFIASNAAIDLTKLATVTASRALVSSAGGVISASSVTATELGYVSGVTSAIQTQFSGKVSTGLITASGLTVSTTNKLLGRSGSGSSAIEELSLDPLSLVISGTTLFAVTAPAGADTNIQYNSAGSLAGSDDWTFGAVSSAQTVRLRTINSTSTAYSQFQFRKARGTTATPTAVQSANPLGEIFFQGYNGAAYVDGANIQAAATANWSNSPATRSTRLILTVTDGNLTYPYNVRFDRIVPPSDNSASLGESGTAWSTLHTRSVTFAGSSSGATVIQAAATAAGTYTWPGSDGTSGQVLSTNGSGVLSWASVTASAGGTNTQLQYNSSNSLAGITGATSNGTNVTFGSGNLIATSPLITTSLTTGSTSFDLINTTATTVNFAGAATTLNMAGGSGAVINLGGGANAAELRFLEPSGSGTNYTALKAQAQAANVTYTLPAADGTSGQVLSTNGSGTLSWATASGGGGGTPGGLTGDYQINGGSNTFAAGVLAESAGRLTGTPTASTTGSTRYLRVLTPADTALTASTEAIGIQFGGNTSVTTVTRQFSAGALTAQREYLFVPPTYSFTSASTITTAATVAIGSSSGFTRTSGNPIAGTNATITNRMALYVDGLVNIGTTTTSDPILGSAMTWGLNVAMSPSARFVVGRADGDNDSYVMIARADNSLRGYWQLNGTGIFFGTWGDAPINFGGSGTAYLSIANSANGNVVGINKSSSFGGQLHVVSGSASRVALRADSAASPTADIAQFTVNGALGAAVNKDARIILAERGTDPAAADLTSGANAKDRIAIYMKNDKLVFAYNDAGTVYYISIPCDGATATTTWTHSTTAP